MSLAGIAVARPAEPRGGAQLGEPEQPRRDGWDGGGGGVSDPKDQREQRRERNKAIQENLESPKAFIDEKNPRGSRAPGRAPTRSRSWPDRLETARPDPPSPAQPGSRRAGRSWT